MVEKGKVNVKISDSQLNKLKSAVKNLRMTIKMFKQFTSWIIIDSKTKNKIRNAFENKMSTDTKFFKTQIYKIIQFCGF